MVFYRKYRPQTIEQLDSTSVRVTLQAMLSQAVTSSPASPSDSVTHAFLFTGPRGLGKTSTARIIAKAVNCERNAFAGKSGGQRAEDKERKAESIEPCNECDACLSITNGTNMDVIEIDAASNRGIDEIRELKEKITLSPSALRKKVYIIDEVHMLTTEAFNALLKTLEEPPSHAMFILCTTEQQKVPVTILSRCFHLLFVSATIEELERSLRRVVEGEKIQITPVALHEIACFAEGGFRDGTKFLEEVTALSGGTEITADLVMEKLHITGFAGHITTLLGFLQKKDTGASLDLVETLVAEKIDIAAFLQQLLKELHQVFLQTLGLKIKDIGLKNQDVKFTNEEIQTLVQLFSEAYRQTKQSFLPQLAIEMAIVRYTSKLKVQSGMLEETSPSLQGVAATKQSTLGQKIATDFSSPRNDDKSVTVGTLRKHVSEVAKVKALYGEPVVVATTSDEPPIETTSVSLLHFSKDGDITPEWLAAFWQSIINEVKKQNHTVAGVLRGCKIKTFDRQILIIETAYQFHTDKLKEEKNLKSLEEICKMLMGNQVVVKIELKV